MLIFPRNGGGFHLKLYFLASKGYYTAKKQRQNLRRRCPGGIPGRKRCHFLRRMGYHPPPEQKNTPKPARKVPGGIPGRKRCHFLRGMGYHPPPEQKNTPKPAQKVPRRDSGQKTYNSRIISK